MADVTVSAVHTPTALGNEKEDEALSTVTDPKSDVGKFMKLAGVDEGLGLVFGWGIVCKEGGQAYVDTQGDHIPEAAMAKASTDFMKNSRQAGEMHDRMSAGTVVHSFPLTAEIAKAMGIETGRTGWMVAVAPDPAMLEKFRSGEFTGFSIGGRVLTDG